MHNKLFTPLFGFALVCTTVMLAGLGSFGLQAGAQSYGYALFFMDESALGLKGSKISKITPD